MADDVTYMPPVDIKPTTPEGAAGDFKGLFADVFGDNPEAAEPQPRAQARAPQRPAPEPVEDTQESPPEPDDDQPRAADEPPDDDEPPADDGPQPVQVPRGMSRDDAERFRSLPPDAQAIVADMYRAQHEARSDLGRQTAERVRQTDAEREAITRERTHYAEQLKTLIPALQAKVQKDADDLATLAKERPDLYVQKLEELRQSQALFIAAQAEQKRVADQEAAESNRRYAEYVDGERKKLEARIPDYADGRKREKLVRDLGDYLLKEVGFDRGDVENLADSRMFETAYKAMMWDRAQKAKAEALKANPPRVMRPGTPQQGRAGNVESAAERLRKSGRVEDAAEVFKRMRVFG